MKGVSHGWSYSSTALIFFIFVFGGVAVDEYQPDGFAFPFSFSHFLGPSLFNSMIGPERRKEKGEPARTQFLVFDNWPVLCQKMSQKKGNADAFHFSFVSLLTLYKSLRSLRLRRAT